MGKYFIIAAILSIILVFINTNYFKGKFGEFSVNCLLKRISKNDKGILYKNIIVLLDNNSHQIDHVLISKKGIFVVETKNYSGTIYGSDYQKDWTQVFNYGKQKYKFYSPVRQNYTHVEVLNNFLNNKYNINNVIIFYKNSINNIKSKYVYTMKTFRDYYNNLSYIYSDKELNEIINTINNINLKAISEKEHIKNINKRKEIIK